MDKVKRIASVLGIMFISSMYIISLISAFIASEKAPGLFLASIFSSVVIPIMIYGFIAIYKYVHKDDIKGIPDDTEKDHK